MYYFYLSKILQITEVYSIYSVLIVALCNSALVLKLFTNYMYAKALFSLPPLFNDSLKKEKK